MTIMPDRKGNLTKQLRFSTTLEILILIYSLSVLKILNLCHEFFIKSSSPPCIMHIFYLAANFFILNFHSQFHSVTIQLIYKEFFHSSISFSNSIMTSKMYTHASVHLHVYVRVCGEPKKKLQ